MPLSDLNVIEFAGVLAGPSAGMFLAEAGAEVLKIEPPGRGDVTRSWRLSCEPAAEKESRSSYFNSINWGKQSLEMDVKAPENRDRLRGLVSAADIALLSFKPGDAEKLGLSYETLSAWNPGLIYASISGYGPQDERLAYDALIQAESGFMHLNRRPETPPEKMPVALIDVLAAHHLKELILLALIQKIKTGRGAEVDVSLFEVAVSSLTNQASAWLSAGAELLPMGSEHPHIFPYGGRFRTADQREIVLAVGSDAQFVRLCHALGDDALAQNPRFARNTDRSTNREELRPELQRLFSGVADAELFLASLHAAKVPAALIRRVSEAVQQYETQFMMHSGAADGFRGLPQLCGRINGKPAARPLSAPPPLGV
jgi:crotonobetainyl-CoA:carnitine CoA-transferase CaiB-like acyl-CoA transferase